MFFLWIYNFFRGYLIFEVTGSFIERFLNLCAKNKITLWKINKKRQGVISACVSVRQFFKLKPIVKIARVRLKILKKRGLVFILKKYKSRYGILAGIVLFVVTMLVMSSYIWSIDVVGNNAVQRDEIIAILKEQGIKEGVHSTTCNIRVAEQALLVRLEKIMWVQIDIVGSKIVVNVKEGVVPPEIIPLNKPCNIVAKKDGQIIYSEIYEGIGVIKKGDTVKKGELIVSGVVGDVEKQMRFVHSRGKILAHTVTELTSEVELKNSENFYTGKFYEHYLLQFGNISVKLYYSDKAKYPQFEQSERINEFYIGKDIVLPIKLRGIKYLQTEKKEYELTKEQAEKIARTVLQQKEKIELANMKVINSEITVTITEKSVLVTGMYTSEEDIAQEEEIFTK